MKLSPQLEMDKCPRCGVDKPNLNRNAGFPSVSSDGAHRRYWAGYVCARCGGVVFAASSQEDGEVLEYFPQQQVIDEAIPEPARKFLRQAINSKHVPDGCVMLCSSAIDAMLKNKNYKPGSLYERINKACDDHLITKEMADWAHEVRLEANEPRHADEAIPHRSEEEAEKVVAFAFALAEFLFVLPAKVTRGRFGAGKDAK